MLQQSPIHPGVKTINERHLHTWIEHTSKRLQEIETRDETPLQKQARASVCIGFLIEELASATLSEDLQAELQQLVTKYQAVGQ